MAYNKQTSTQKLTELQDKVDKHDGDIDEQKSVTKFFTIIVGCTLVATLAGLVGLYINAFNNNSYVDRLLNDKSLEVTELRRQISVTQSELVDTSHKIDLIKAKNPYLK